MVRGHLPEEVAHPVRLDGLRPGRVAELLLRPPEPAAGFENVHHLRGFLAGVARNKVFEEHRRLTKTEKYADRPRGAAVRPARRSARSSATSSRRSRLPARPSRPATGWPSSSPAARPREVQVITLRHQGLTFEEIAARTGIHERSVRRIIEEARAANGGSGMALTSPTNPPAEAHGSPVLRTCLVPSRNPAAPDRREASGPGGAARAELALARRPCDLAPPAWPGPGSIDRTAPTFPRNRSPSFGLDRWAGLVLSGGPGCAGRFHPPLGARRGRPASRIIWPGWETRRRG